MAHGADIVPLACTMSNSTSPPIQGFDESLADANIMSCGLWPSTQFLVQGLAVLLSYPLLLLVCRLLTSLRQGWRLRHLPSPSGGFLGVAGELVRRQDRHRVYTEWAQALGPVFKVRIVLKHQIVVTDPVIIAEAVRRSTELDKNTTSQYFRKFNSVKGHPSMVNMRTDERWKAVRKEAAVCFSPGNMRACYPHIQAACQQLVDIVKTMGPDATIDFDDAMCRESLDVIGRVGFGRDMGATRALHGDFAADAMEKTQASMAEAEKRTKDPLRRYRIWSKDVWKGEAAVRRYNALIHGLVADLRANPPLINTIAAHLAKAIDPATGEPLTDEFLAPECGLMFFAGFESTGHSAAWALFAVSQAPEVEAKIVAELSDLGLLATTERPSPRQVDWDDVSRLCYLNCVIKEVLRQYPVAGLTTLRENVSGRDVALDGGRLVVPPGVELYMPVAALHASPTLWPRPDAFLPERWLEEGAEDAVVGHSRGANAKSAGKRYMPFSMGARDCVGQALGRLNLATLLAMLYGHFSFSLHERMGGPKGVAAAEHTSLSMYCKAGMHMRVHWRVPPGVPASNAETAALWQ